MVARIGDVVVPSGTDVWHHELATAKAPAMAGHDVEFLPRIDGKEVKSADVLMDSIIWEMKSPTSASVKSLQKALRRAGRQSHNVVVDTARMRGVSDRAVQRELVRLLPLVASVQRLRLATKARDAFDITQRRGRLLNEGQRTVRKYLPRGPFSLAVHRAP